MSTPLRCLIVDDVQLARDRLRRLLGMIEDIEIVGEAANVTDALERVHEHAPELIFLDIEMPERDGFALIADLPESLRPAVVFVTAYDQHAVRAFAADAIDYLLKLQKSVLAAKRNSRRFTPRRPATSAIRRSKTSSACVRDVRNGRRNWSHNYSNSAVRRIIRIDYRCQSTTVFACWRWTISTGSSLPATICAFAPATKP